MKKHTFTIPLLFAITNIILDSSLFAMDQKAKTETQMQRFKKSFPEDVAAYLHNKQVGSELKERLDAVFCKPEIEKALAALYDRPKHDDSQAQEQAKTILIQNGFIFLLSDLIPSKTHVYTHCLFPEFVFKQSPTVSEERLNASRIRYAQELQEKDICPCKKIKIRCPHKQTYMPYLDKQELLPLVMVVADKIDLSQLHGLSQKQYTALREIGFRDASLHADPFSNAGAIDNDIMIYDTEPLGARLNYPKKTALQEKKYHNAVWKFLIASWLCLAACIAYKSLSKYCALKNCA